jgi:arginyl-tRNA synthetase
LASNRLDELAAALGTLAEADVELERPPERQPGDYATNVALRTAKAAGRPPRELAEELARKAESLPEVERAEVAGPGFVNLHLTDDFFRAALAEVREGYGGGFAERPERVQAEMVSANPTGPITVASARNGAYGDSVARLLEFAGHEVSREYYYNDAGAQLDRFRASVEAVRRGEPPPPDGYQGDYVRQLAAYEGDPVPAMVQQIEATLGRFRIHFDSWANESELARGLPELLERLPTYEQDGAIFVRSTEFGDEKDRVLVRSPERGGLPTYEAADIAYLRDKLERGFDRALYVLGADHQGVAGWYAVVARMLGYDPARVEVLLYQLVHLTRGGEQTKMSKRRGDVVFLDDFLDEIGVDAARWFLVDRGPDREIEIDVDLAVEKTRRNPVYYVQYAHARISGILRDAPASPKNSVVPYDQHERELVKRLAEFPSVVRNATAKRGPQQVAAYAIEVADDFNRFYDNCRVLGSEQEASRLVMCRATREVIARSLHLLGVDAPERM